MAEQAILSYYKCVLSHGWGALVMHGKITALAVVGTIVSVILLAKFQINPSSQTLLRTLAGIAWPVLLLMVYVLVYVVRAPWRMHQEDARIIKELRARPPLIIKEYWVVVQFALRATSTADGSRFSRSPIISSTLQM
jgi:hypothetical protein